MKYSRSDRKQIADRLLWWMVDQDFLGWDPHDGLNSPILRPLSSVHRWAGVAGLQAVKRCRFNLRPFLGVPKVRNAKGIGLVVTALVQRFQLYREQEDLAWAVSLARWLDRNKVHVNKGFGWGYPFDWPNRAFFAPAGTPTLVNTAFIAHGILDLFEVSGDRHWLEVAEAAGAFISHDLNRSPGPEGFCFSYTPIDHSRVHNANLLGASLLARLGNKINDARLIVTALESASFSVAAQNPDGSWPYGEAANQKWVDSFHTGYDLLALKSIWKEAGASGRRDIFGLHEALNKGYLYYLRNFFLSDGTVKYFAHKSDPLDAHAFAHAVLCLSEMKDHPATGAELAKKVADRMIQLFWSGDGYFHWQIEKGRLYRLACMRWVQAWVLLALHKLIVAQGSLI